MICDFAETYHITDIRALPVPLLATLASGLRDNSRAKMKISGNKLTTENMLLAISVDRLGLLYWIESGNARAKKERPASILDMLLGKDKKKESEYRIFTSADDFNRERNRIMRKGNGN